MACERLGPGQYLGPPVWDHSDDGLRLTLCRYRAGLVHTWHVHAHPTIFVLIDGAHWDRSRHDDHRQAELTGVFHPVTEPHATAVGSSGMIGLNVEITERWLNRHGVRQQELGGYQLLNSPFDRMALLRLLGGLVESSFSKSIIETAILELIEPRTPKRPATMTRPSWLDRAEEFLRCHYRRPISLRDVADEVGMHPVYVAEIFRVVLGQSVGERLRMLRLAEAGRLIVHDGCSLCEAAMLAGFTDQPHFTRFCRRSFRFTPTRFQQIRRFVSQPA